MAIVAEQTLGEVVIYEVNSAPDFSAPPGSLAFSNAVGGLYIYRNGHWLALTVHDEELHYFAGTGNTFAPRDDADGTYYVFNATQTYSLSGIGTGNWSINSNYRLQYNGETPVRVMCRGLHTFTTGTGFWSHESLIFGINNTVPPDLIENTTSCDVDSFGQHQETIKVSQVFDLYKGNWISLGRGSVARETGGGGGAAYNYTTNLYSIRAEVVDTGKFIGTVFTENWESGNFTANGWTVVNDTTNQWRVGTATKDTGTYSAYISNDGGATNTYTLSANDVSHFYKDITFPSGTTLATIEFRWKGQGENAAGDDQYDYGRVFLPTTAITPVAGTQVTTDQIGALKYNLQGTYATAAIVIGSEDGFDLDGTTRRLIFSWKDDTTQGAQPPWSIDNIVIKAYKY